MISRSFAKYAGQFAVALSVVCLAASTTWAASSTWIQGAAGTYSWDTNAATNWASGAPADGAGNTADFSTGLNILGDETVNLDTTGHSIGSLIFGDTDPSSAGGWTIGGPNTLTLDNVSATVAPVITLNTLGAGKSVTISAPLNTAINGAANTGLGFTLTGVGSLNITTPYASTFTGPTILNGSGAAPLSLTYSGANNTNVKGLQFGIVTANLGTPTVGTINVNTNVTATSLLAQTNTGNVNNIVIASGKTLTINGGITLGYNIGSVTTTATTNLTVSGGGSLVAGGGSSILAVGVDNGTTNATNVLDLTGLSNFQFTGGSSSEVRVAGNGTANSSGGNHDNATLKLSNTANTINVGTVTVAGGAGGTGGTTTSIGGVNYNAVLSMGAGSNVIDAANIYVGTFKLTGLMQWGGTPGSITIRNQAGTGGANIIVGQNAANTNSSNPVRGDINLNGAANVDILANTITLGLRTGTATGTSTGNSTANFNFDKGTVTTTTLNMANRVNLTGNTTGHVTNVIAGMTIGGTGVLNVGTGGFTLANNTNTGIQPGNAIGTLTLLGNSQVNSQSNITTVVGTGHTGGLGSGDTMGNISLQGGTLNLMGNSIGDAIQPILITGDSASPSNISGTIMNVAGINEPATGTNAGTTVINKTGTGILTLAGTNSYTGDTVVAGSSSLSGIVVTGKLLSTGNVIVNSGTLAGNGNGTTTGVMGNVTLNGGGFIDPGASLADNQFGTISMSSLNVTGGTLRFDLTTPAGSNDLIKVGSGGAQFNGSSQITLGTIPQPGTYNLLTVTGGTLSGTVPTQPSIASTRSSFQTQFSGNNLQLVVTGNAHNLTWTGSGGGNGSTWDLNTTQNWSNNGSTTTPNDTFFNLDSVTFTDTPSAPTNRNITLNTQVLPASVTVNNGSGNDYSINGTGDISGTGGISKQGAGNLTLGTANSYTGPTNVTGGTLILSATGGIVSTGGITIGASGTLQLGNADAASNSGTGGTGVGIGLGNSTSSAPAIVDNGTFAVNTTAGTTASAVPIFNAIGGNGNVAVNGTGVVKLSGTNSYLGTTTIASGATLQVNDATSLGSTAGGSVTVASGGTLDFQTAPTNLASLGSKTFFIAGSGVSGVGAIFLDSGHQQTTALQNVTLTADASIAPGGRLDVAGGTLNLGTGVVGGAQPGNTLTLLGGTFAISTTTVTDGNINVTTGTGTTGRVNFNTGAVVQGNGTITFNAGTSALFTGNAAGTITRPISWAGSTMGINSGNATTVNSPISLQTDLNISPVVTTTPGVFTLAGNITQDSTPRALVVTSNATSAIASTVVLSGNNSFTGGVFIGSTDNATPGAILQLGSTGALNSSGANAVTFSDNSAVSAGLRLAGNSVTIAGLNANSTSPFVENASASPATLTVNTTTSNNFNGALQDGAGGGPLSFAVSGSGSMTLSGMSTNTGAMTVLGGGTLNLSGLIASSALNVQNGQLNFLQNVAPPNAVLTLGDASNHNGTVDVSGHSITLSAINTVGNGSANIITNSSSSSGATLTIDGGTGIFNGSILNKTGATGTGAGTLALHVGGNAPATLTLNGVNTYTGGTSMGSGSTLTLGSAGTLVGDVSVSGTFVVNGSVASNSNVTLNGNSAVLAGTTTVAGAAGNVVANGGIIAPGNILGTLNIRTLQSNGADIRFDLPATDSGTHDKVVVSGAVQFNGGPTTLTPLSPGSLAIGTYTLMTYASQTGGTDPNNLTLNVPANTRANFHFTVGSTSITIAPDANPLNLTWVGGANGAVWDVGSTGTQNWSNAGSGVITANDKFFNLDTVNFTDASGNRTVNLTTSLQPSAVNVSNNNGTYTFTGNGSINGLSTTLNMSGSSTLIVTTSNTYGDGTSISNSGTIQLGNGTTNNSGGSLGTGPITGIGAGGKLVFDYPNGLNISNSISGPISLTVTAGGNVTLSGTNTYSGNTTVKSGTLTVNSANALPSGTMMTLGDPSNSGSANNVLALNNGNATVGGLVALGSGANSITGGNTLIYAGATNTVAGVVQNGTSTFSGAIQTGGLTAHSGTLILTGTNNVGGVTVDAGATLQVGNGGAGGTLVTPTTGTFGTVVSGSVTSNGTLVFDRSDDLDLTGATVSGNGGLSLLGTGKMTLSSSNSYSGSTVIGAGATAIVTSSSSLGAVPGGPVTINAGGTLDLGGDTTPGSLVFGAKAFFIAGTGVNNAGAIENSVAANAESAGVLQNVTLTGDATISAVGRIDMRGGTPSLDLAGHTLTITGGQQFSFFSGNVTAGSFDVQAGTLSFQQTATVNGPADGSGGIITLENGSRLSLNTVSNSINRPIVVNGAVTFQNSSGSSSFSSPVKLNGNLTFTGSVAGTTMSLLGNISETGGPHSVTVNNANAGAAVVLAGSNTYSGPTTVTAGLLQLGAANSVPSTSRLVMNGGTFNTGGFSNQTGSLQTLASSVLDMSTVNSSASPQTSETLQFADSSLAHWRYSTATAPVLLNIMNWSGTGSDTDLDQIVFPTATSLNANELSQIQFNGTGYAKLRPIASGPNSSKFELVPSATLPSGILTLGDINQDGSVNVGDVSALMSALADLNGYEKGTATYSGTATPIRTTGGVWNASQLIYVADVNLDGVVDNRDIQSLINYIANGLTGGGGSLTAVPEPTSFVLLGLGGVVCFAVGKRRRKIAR